MNDFSLDEREGKGEANNQMACLFTLLLRPVCSFRSELISQTMTVLSYDPEYKLSPESCVCVCVREQSMDHN